jgi:steroid 5-alpha reductase family enzyme
MMMNDFLFLMLVGLATAVFIMLVLWLVYRRTGNPAVVDPGWAATLGILALVYSFAGHGHPIHRILIAIVAGGWGFRLSWYLLVNRVLGGHRDGRYDALQQQWKTGVPWKFLLFFQFQALLAAILSVPFLFVAMNQQPNLVIVEYIAAAIWLVAIVGETASDNQLKSFKQDPTNQGKVCQVGLWNYSRHPNYFFEWLVWIAFFMAAVAAPTGWVSVYCPALMLYFLFRVTGIPMTEEQSIRTKGEAYREYQKTTSAFIPWMKKEVAINPESMRSK